MAVKTKGEDSSASSEICTTTETKERTKVGNWRRDIDKIVAERRRDECLQEL